MINFTALEIKVNTNYSFVGIQKEGSKLIFYIPKGFSEDDINTFDKKRDLFFRLYRVLNVFKQICIEKGYLKKNKQANDRDGVLEVDTGSEITSDDDSKNIFYSKLDALGSILDAYDELKILGLVSRLGKSERLDYSKLHRYLNNAIFLNNGAIYIDAMNLPRKEIHFDTTDIVAMYCYILTEIKEQLQQQVNPEIKSLAERFQEKYLGIESSLFSEKYYLRVINELKDALESIDHYTPIKDSDYWDFYEAIYKFLFGDLDNSLQGEVWGFSNFNTIWESMCLTYLVRTLNPGFILYLDNQFISRQILIKFNFANKAIDISSIFKINATEIFPDAVIIQFQEISYQELGQNSISYKLEISNWDDFSYRTSFWYRACKRQIKIAYPNQSIGNHTYKELAKFCPIKYNILTITSLPKYFYSYWDIPDELSIKEIHMMRCLNHIFYIAADNGFLYFEDFYQKLIQDQNVVEESLLRDISHDKKLRNESFQRFINFSYEQKYFTIIDIKYSTPEYYTNADNIEEIKSRSVRKQFVYEYLLQKHLEKTNHPLKELDIKSEFWLPAYSETQETFTPMSKYMDDYIKLTGVNIMTVIDSYLETEEK
ncbi:hypothetical protein IQ227_12070 [Anabaena aphanizomenioides LEGE 00250]|uniref:DUF2357 domain-containing protein n=1 Tax=Sphaerospermopsis aphanizomenoides LEGE 00250 TaxID=2777972 RepID=A0ABR9VE30_9CYAN|nr:hypothetical protein [Sphaerospermopsis aphanizomenoides]MBE9236741.1 hypothetical protein [Sphaerospermopsis aphanizomenoides LEGE 00250]